MAKSKLRVVEVFDSIQGEGGLMGLPHTFIRLAGCNLRCRWCDTKYALDAPGVEMSVDDVVSKVNCGYVCLTGGEPLLQDVYGLLGGLKGKKVTVETNCTVRDERLDEFVFLYSVSPKLSSSGEGYDVRVLESYLNLDNVRVKFVVCDDDDFLEAVSIVEKYNAFVRGKVVLQPDGMCSMSEYQRRLGWLCGKVMGCEVLVRSDVRVLLQLHKVIWGNKRGV